MKCPQCRFDNPTDTNFCGKCGQSLHEPPGPRPEVTETLETAGRELVPGSIFAGRYQVIEELGRGGMGRVYRVTDKKLNEDVALKLIKPEIASDRETVERFRNELKTARKIGHRNVTRMFDLGQEGITHFITMEYVRGEDLKSFIRRSGRLTLDKAVSIATQVCEGLEEAHRQGVVHRDLKPSNVMIDREGNARIMDFGIARSVKPGGITGKGVMIGTPEYMSPEQVEGLDLDERSDVYSLGIILYEMLTGAPPFTGDSTLSVAMKQKNDPAPDPRTRNPLISEPLVRLVLKCLEKDSGRRYPNASEVRLELDRIGADLTPATEAGPGIRTAKDRGPFSWRRLKPAGIAFFVIIVAAAGYFLIERKPRVEKSAGDVFPVPQWKNSIAVMPFQDMSPMRDQEVICNGMATDIIGRLGKIRDLKVCALTSIIYLKDSKKTPQEIARELGVSHFLDGTIQREGETIRITPFLYETDGMFIVWTDSYDRQVSGFYDLQDEISLAVAEALKVHLTAASLDAYKTRQPGDMRLYETFHQAMDLINTKYAIFNREEDFTKALQAFIRALEMDPSFAPTYNGLAWAYWHRYQNTADGEDLRQVIVNIGKGYAHDPELPESNLGKGFALFMNNKFDEAFKFYGIALEKDPNNLVVCQGLGYSYMKIGLAEKAIPFFQKVIDLSPFYIYAKINLAWCFRDLGDRAKAGEYLKESWDLNPKNPFSLAWYAGHLVREKRYSEAERMLEELENVAPEFSELPIYKAFLFAARGDKDKALGLHQDPDVYALLGMKDEAIQAIRKRAEKRGTYLYLDLVNNLSYQALRSDPLFKEILSKAKKEYESFLAKYGNLR